MRSFIRNEWSLFVTVGLRLMNPLRFRFPPLGDRRSYRRTFPLEKSTTNVAIEAEWYLFGIQFIWNFPRGKNQGEKGEKQCANWTGFQGEISRFLTTLSSCHCPPVFFRIFTMGKDDSWRLWWTFPWFSKSASFNVGQKIQAKMTSFRQLCHCKNHSNNRTESLL